MTTVEVGSKDWQDNVLSSKIPVIVDFWAPWCPWCMKLMPIFEEVSALYDSRLTFAKVNAEEEQEIAKENDVLGIPVMKIFHNGKKIGEFVGFMNKEKLVQEIEKVMVHLQSTGFVQS